MNWYKNLIGFIALGSLVAACSDASEADFSQGNGTAGEAGSAGSAGNSNVVPPGTGGSSGSVSPSTGGSAGEAGSSSVTPPDAGAAGSNPSTDAGTICAGESCEFGHASACVQNDTVYECSCLGIYLPQGVNLTCGDAGTAGAGGSDAGSVVIPPEAGTAGAGGSGGSSSTGGSGGSSATGGSGGSTSTGGSGGTVGTGGTGGSATVAGTMTVTIVAPIAGQHTYTVHAQTLAFMPGEPDWNTPKTVTGTSAVVTYTAYAGSVFKLGGYYDPPSSDPATLWTHQFCSPATLKLTATVFATLDGKALPVPLVKSNGQGGCDLWITATPLGTGCVDDMDCDGYKAHASDPALKDCEDYAAEVHPGQNEDPGGKDLNCDGNIDPARVGYRILIGQQSYVPVLFDWGHGGTQYTMTFNSNGYYETFISLPIASADFVIQYGSGNWNVGWDYSNPGSCVNSATVKVYNEATNLPYTTTSVAIPQYTTCHTAVSGL